LILKRWKIVQGISIDRLFVQPIIRSILRAYKNRSIEFLEHIKIDRSKYIRSIDFASSRRSRYFQIFVRSKLKVEFYGQKWMATSSVCAARIDPWWVFCKSKSLYIWDEGLGFKHASCGGFGFSQVYHFNFLCFSLLWCTFSGPKSREQLLLLLLLCSSCFSLCFIFLL
jgi:hypothetical protein